MRILVTGGTGFIGSFLVERLLDRGDTVRVPIRAENYRALSARRADVEWMKGDLRDPEFCMELTAGVDEVYHLASCRRDQRYHLKKPSDVLAENLRMTLAMIEGLKEHNPMPVTVFSTANVPATLDAAALAETPDTDGYVLSKALCEAVWLAAARQRKFPLLVVRPVGVYGPRDTFNEEANIIPTLMVKARDAEEYLDAWGDGSQERAFLYVEDLIDALLKLREHDVEGIQYITSSQVVTVEKLAEMIRDLVRPDLPIQFDESKSVGSRAIPKRPVDRSLAKMSWTPLEEGLKRTYDAWRRIPQE